MMATGGSRIIDAAELYGTLEAAIADCTFVFAATARAHDQAKPVVGAAEAAELMAPRIMTGGNVAILFGRERNGLENDEVALADGIVTLPVNAAFASLNLAQAVVIVAYEWFKLASGAKLPFAMPEKSPQAPKEQLFAFFAALERELEKVEFFRPPDKRETMQINLRNIFTRMQPTQQDIHTPVSYTHLARRSFAAVSSSTSSPATMPPRQRKSAILRAPLASARLTSGSISAAASVVPPTSASSRSLA